jgi:hypothetical protein
MQRSRLERALDDTILVSYRSTTRLVGLMSRWLTGVMSRYSRSCIIPCWSRLHIPDAVIGVKSVNYGDNFFRSLLMLRSLVQSRFKYLISNIYNSAADSTTIRLRYWKRSPCSYLIFQIATLLHYEAASYASSSYISSLLSSFTTNLWSSLHELTWTSNQS